MTDVELLQLAANALPDAQKRLKGTILRRAGAGPTPPFTPGDGSPDNDEELLQDLERLLDEKLPRQQVSGADSVDVAFHEDTPIGRRTTVVQIRYGKVVRTIGQA